MAVVFARCNVAFLRPFSPFHYLLLLLHFFVEEKNQALTKDELEERKLNFENEEKLLEVGLGKNNFFLNFAKI